jgi:hypothetical protein
VVRAPNDKQQLQPMLGKLTRLSAELGNVGELLAENGCFSEANVNACVSIRVRNLPRRSTPSDREAVRLGNGDR